MSKPEYNIFKRMRDVRRRLPVLGPKLFHIRTKEKGIITWTPSAAQNQILLDPDTGADIILKARQLGISTMSVLEFLAYVLFVDGFNGIIISEDESKAKQLLQIAWLALDMLPPEKRPPLKHGQERYIITEAPIYDKNGKKVGGGRGSSLYIGTAGKYTLGRGQTIHAAHMSELAFWPSEAGQDADDLLQGLEEAVPDRPGAILRIESTANGYGNVFHQYWTKAARGVGRYRGHFFPWWFALDDEYKKPVRGTLERTEEEHDFVEMVFNKYRFRMTDEHLQWRRDKIDQKGKKFWVEYPEGPDSCFLSTGAAVFNEILEQLDGTRKRLENVEPLYERDRHGVNCRYWSGARAGKSYLITVDMAEGEKEKSDFNAALVCEVTREGQVKEAVSAQGRTSAPTFAQVVMELATEFNGALVVVERANKGYSVLDTLLQNVDANNYEYEIYFHEEFDADAKKMNKIAGFRTTKQAKEVAVQRWLEDVKSGFYFIREPIVVAQALGYQSNPRTGKMEAQRGTYDDLLMCAVMASYTKLDVSQSKSSDVIDWD